MQPSSPLVRSGSHFRPRPRRARLFDRITITTLAHLLLLRCGEGTQPAYHYQSFQSACYDAVLYCALQLKSKSTLPFAPVRRRCFGTTPSQTMVYCGKASQNCQSCRTRRIKVRLLPALLAMPPDLRGIFSGATFSFFSSPSARPEFEQLPITEGIGSFPNLLIYTHLHPPLSSHVDTVR